MINLPKTDLLLQLLFLESWREGLRDLSSLGNIRNLQGIEILGQAELELGHASDLFDLDICEMKASVTKSCQYNDDGETQ